MSRRRPARTQRHVDAPREAEERVLARLRLRESSEEVRGRSEAEELEAERASRRAKGRALSDISARPRLDLG